MIMTVSYGINLLVTFYYTLVLGSVTL